MDEIVQQATSSCIASQECVSIMTQWMCNLVQPSMVNQEFDHLGNSKQGVP